MMISKIREMVLEEVQKEEEDNTSINYFRLPAATFSLIVDKVVKGLLVTETNRFADNHQNH